MHKGVGIDDRMGRRFTDHVKEQTSQGKVADIMAETVYILMLPCQFVGRTFIAVYIRSAILPDLAAHSVPTMIIHLAPAICTEYQSGQYIYLVDRINSSSCLPNFLHRVESFLVNNCLVSILNHLPIGSIVLMLCLILERWN